VDSDGVDDGVVEVGVLDVVVVVVPVLPDDVVLVVEVVVAAVEGPPGATPDFVDAAAAEAVAGAGVTNGSCRCPGVP
jgi:hypothetical protein